MTCAINQSLPYTNEAVDEAWVDRQCRPWGALLQRQRRPWGARGEGEQ